jgi:hypothetical protein
VRNLHEGTRHEGAAGEVPLVATRQVSTGIESDSTTNSREEFPPRLDARLLGAVQHRSAQHLTDGSYGTPAASEANTAERKKRLLITAQMNTWVFCA